MKYVVVVAVSVFVAVDLVGAARAIGAFSRRRAAIGTAIAAVVAVAALADWFLDAVDVSVPAAQLAAGVVLIVPVVERLANLARPTALTFPLLVSPATVVVVLALSGVHGAGTTAMGAALGIAAAVAVALAWRPGPVGAAARLASVASGSAVAVLAFDLVRDGVFGP